MTLNENMNSKKRDKILIINYDKTSPSTYNKILFYQGSISKETRLVLNEDLTIRGFPYRLETQNIKERS